MQKYYEINDTEAVKKIDAALSASNKFDEKLHIIIDSFNDSHNESILTQLSNV